MKLLTLLLTIFVASCASTSAKDIDLLPFEKRIYVTCEKEHTPEPKGKLCFKQCSKRYRISKKCFEWFTDVLVLKDNHDKFYNWEMRILKN